MKKAEMLDAVKKTVIDRGDTYGTVLEDFKVQAAIWSLILGIEVQPKQVAACMIGVKLARLNTTPNHLDSVMDIAGYAACWSELIDEESK